MKDKVLCCPICEEPLLIEQRGMIKGSNYLEGYCIACYRSVNYSKAIWKGV